MPTTIRPHGRVDLAYSSLARHFLITQVRRVPRRKGAQLSEAGDGFGVLVHRINTHSIAHPTAGAATEKYAVKPPVVLLPIDIAGVHVAPDAAPFETVGTIRYDASASVRANVTEADVAPFAMAVDPDKFDAGTVDASPAMPLVCKNVDWFIAVLNVPAVALFRWTAPRIVLMSVAAIWSVGADPLAGATTVCCPTR